MASSSSSQSSSSSVLLLLLLACSFCSSVCFTVLTPLGRPRVTSETTRTLQYARRGKAGLEETSRKGALAKGLTAGAAVLTAGLGFFSPSATRPAFAELPSSATSANNGTAVEPKTIIITGANSGIGLDAAGKLAAQGHQVYVACRTLSKAQEAAKTAGAAGAFECDLTSLASVRKFIEDWGSRPIDVLCLNAGVAMNTAEKTPHFTAEGFEETIGVNHFGHFLIAQKLLGNLEKSKLTHPRLVVTASSVHDPDTPGGNVGPGATLGDLKGFTDFLEQGKRFEMVDGAPYNPDKSYKDSKLLNVLFTEEMSRRLAASKSKVRCNCFSPGLIPSTGLFRSQNPLFVGAFNFIAVKVLGVGKSIKVNGSAVFSLPKQLVL